MIRRLLFERRLSIIIFFITITSLACTARHIVIPEDPNITSSRADYSHVKLFITSFTVRNLSNEDNAGSIENLKKKLLEYIKNDNDFSLINYASMEVQMAEEENYILMKIQIDPELIKKRTYILDLPFFYPMIGYWPVTPLWGTTSVNITAQIFDKNNNLIKSISTEAIQNYKVIFYSWYRTEPIESAFRIAYHNALSSLAEGIRDNRSEILSFTDPLTKPKIEISSDFIEANKTTLKIAVLEFEEKGKLDVPDAGTIIAEWIMNSLHRTGAFILYERVLLKKVLEEHELNLSGLVSEETIVEIGSIYGVEAIVTGSIIKFGQTISVNVRLIDTKTTQILASAVLTTKTLDAIPEELEELVSKLVNKR